MKEKKFQPKELSYIVREKREKRETKEKKHKHKTQMKIAKIIFLSIMKRKHIELTRKALSLSCVSFIFTAKTQK